MAVGHGLEGEAGCLGFGDAERLEKALQDAAPIGGGLLAAGDPASGDEQGRPSRRCHGPPRATHRGRRSDRAGGRPGPGTKNRPGYPPTTSAAFVFVLDASPGSETSRLVSPLKIYEERSIRASSHSAMPGSSISPAATPSMAETASSAGTSRLWPFNIANMTRQPQASRLLPSSRG